MTNGKRNGIYIATAAAVTCALTLLGTSVASYAAFFRDAVPRDEIKPLVVRQNEQGEKLSRLEGSIEARLTSIENGITRLEESLRSNR